MTPNAPNQTDTQLPGGPPRGPRLPSRLVAAALIVLMLGIGVAAGVAIGPAPASSLSPRTIGRVLASIARSAAPVSAAPGASAALQAPPAASPPPSPAPASTSAPASASVTESAGAPASASVPESAGAPASAQTTAPPTANTQSSAALESVASKEPEPASEGPAELAPSGGSKRSAAPAPELKLPPITKVWLIDLSGVTFEEAKAHASAAPYLTGRLLASGTLLERYALLGDGALANDIALLSGQAPNADTERDCPTYAEVLPVTFSARTGLAAGPGCVYPASVPTLADQLATATLTWRAYIEDLPPAGLGTTGTVVTGSTGPTGPTGAQTAAPVMRATHTGNEDVPADRLTPVADPAASTEGAASCPHPALGAPDPTSAPGQAEPYAGFRNPFVYFDSLLSSGACAADDLHLEGLAGNLADPAETPALTWIVPSRCDDGSAGGCAPGAPAPATASATPAPASGAGTTPAGAQSGGLSRADAFLKRLVPAIERTDAFREHGLIVITSDSPTAAALDQSPTRALAHGRRSGATVGALLISPFVGAGATVASPFNPFSLLKSLERLFGVPLLGHAADRDTASFGASIYRTTKQPTTPDQ
jgi:hypothetical protein